MKEFTDKERKMIAAAYRLGLEDGKDGIGVGIAHIIRGVAFQLKVEDVDPYLQTR